LLRLWHRRGIKHLDVIDCVSSSVFQDYVCSALTQVLSEVAKQSCSEMTGLTMETDILINAVNERVVTLLSQNRLHDDVRVARLKREICAAVASDAVSMREALEYLKGWVPADEFNGVAK